MEEEEQGEKEKKGNLTNLFDSIGERVGGALIETFNTRPVYEI